MTRFPAIVETYLSDLRRIRASGGATAEVSSYGPLENLLNAIGDGLRPKVFCVGQLKDQGAGRPDFGLFASRGRTRGGRTNVGALRMEWPRISLPHWSELSARSGTGETDMAAKIDEASDTLADSVARGRDFAALLDPETPVSGVTTGQLRPEIAAIAVPATTHGHNMFGDDFGLTAGWGHFGSGQAVMSGQGRAVERAHTGSERSAPGTAWTPCARRCTTSTSTTTFTGGMCRRTCGITGWVGTRC